jgi:pyrophosphatase PpaX
MKGITTLLFDIDGTVLDTKEFILQATEFALRALGHNVPERDFISKIVGTPFPQYYLDLGGSIEHAPKLVELHRLFQFENFHLSKPFNNTVETLLALKNKKYKIAAVTTRSKKTSIQTIMNAGLLDVFDTIVSFEDTGGKKPDPAPLFQALEILGETADRAVMIGDSHLDIQAGKNAGVKTIRATYGFHQDKLDEPKPDFTIDDIKDLLKLL